MMRAVMDDYFNRRYRDEAASTLTLGQTYISRPQSARVKGRPEALEIMIDEANRFNNAR